LGLYARENGQGLFFDPQEYADIEPVVSNAVVEEPVMPKKSGLRILD
jgi:stringent starvation protein B